MPDTGAGVSRSERDPSGDLLRVLEAAERDLAGMPEDLHVRATLDALASIRTALDIVRSNAEQMPENKASLRALYDRLQAAYDEPLGPE